MKICAETIDRIVVGRKRTETSVSHRIVHEDGGIRVEMSLDDFFVRLSEEMGGSLLSSKSGMLKKLQSAARTVLQELHETSAIRPLLPPSQ